MLLSVTKTMPIMQSITIILHWYHPKQIKTQSNVITVSSTVQSGPSNENEDTTTEKIAGITEYILSLRILREKSNPNGKTLKSCKIHYTN